MWLINNPVINADCDSLISFAWSQTPTGFLLETVVCLTFSKMSSSSSSDSNLYNTHPLHCIHIALQEIGVGGGGDGEYHLSHLQERIVHGILHFLTLLAVQLMARDQFFNLISLNSPMRYWAWESVKMPQKDMGSKWEQGLQATPTFQMDLFDQRFSLSSWLKLSAFVLLWRRWAHCWNERACWIYNTMQSICLIWMVWITRILIKNKNWLLPFPCSVPLHKANVRIWPCFTKLLAEQ